MKNIFYAASILVMSCSAASAQKQPLYKNKDAPVEKRIDDLIGQMTLEEKIMQMTQWTYGKNANPNNIGEQMKAVRPEIGPGTTSVVIPTPAVRSIAAPPRVAATWNVVPLELTT